MRGSQSELAETAEDAARLSANPQSLSWALWVRALAATAAGDHALALRSGEECMQVGSTVDDNVISADGGWVFGAALLEAGQPERCRAEVLASGGGPDLLRVGLRRPLHVLRAAHEGRAGARPADRGGGLGEAGDRAGRRPSACPWPGPTAAGRRPSSSWRRASHARAAELALAAADDAERAAAPIEAARARTLAGRALALAGDRDRAVAELERAEGELAVVRRPVLPSRGRPPARTARAAALDRRRRRRRAPGDRRSAR